jgi:hypothetical protein
MQRTLVVLEDDLDGSEAAETIEFAVDGAQYSIDLSEPNAEQLRAALDKYIDKARRIGGRRPSRRSVSQKIDKPIDNAAVRAWAASHGIEVSSRGRISAAVIEQFQAAGN